MLAYDRAFKEPRRSQGVCWWWTENWTPNPKPETSKWKSIHHWKWKDFLPCVPRIVCITSGEPSRIFIFAVKQVIQDSNLRFYGTFRWIQSYDTDTDTHTHIDIDTDALHTQHPPDPEGTKVVYSSIPCVDMRIFLEYTKFDWLMCTYWTSNTCLTPYYS